ncbi:hypothetical protein [Acidithiobacillus ferridurans]|uniref:hypothetical protein n=1 Tax=Acidithiobacillus ferridurans TaxID=1232575 RepID=UPI001C06BDDD|nr:hypothetical protein [Acidithiobacillus ferridurans]MBU2732296.1 hypothetical protein [Acidithiobacillus ferridurans]
MKKVPRQASGPRKRPLTPPIPSPWRPAACGRGALVSVAAARIVYPVDDLLQTDHQSLPQSSGGAFKLFDGGVSRKN